MPKGKPRHLYPHLYEKEAPVPEQPEQKQPSPAMSLALQRHAARIEFAKAAITGICANPQRVALGVSPAAWADLALQVGDAMLERSLLAWAQEVKRGEEES